MILSSFHVVVNKFITVLPLLENRAAQHDRNKKWEDNIQRKANLPHLESQTNASQFRIECILPAWHPGQLQYSLKSLTLKVVL